jgi:hypothetical protein
LTDIITGSKESQIPRKSNDTIGPESILPSLSKKVLDSHIEFWTKEGLIDELVFRVGSITSFEINEVTKEISISHKYYDRAEWLIYRINRYKPIPEFVFNLSDLTYRSKREVTRLLVSAPATLNDVMTNTVRRIVEAVDPKYYHLAGIHGKIRWRIDP